MKAITICQPFAHLICLPESDPRCKRVENRSQRWGWDAPSLEFVEAGEAPVSTARRVAPDGTAGSEFR